MASRPDPDVSTETPDADAIEDTRRTIERHLSRSLHVVEVQHVHLGEVAARTGAAGIEDDLGTHEALFRITVRPPGEMDVLDTRNDVTGFLRREFATSVAKNTVGHDTRIVATDMPPDTLEAEPLVYYVRSPL